MTNNEKWIFYKNIKWCKQWLMEAKCLKQNPKWLTQCKEYFSKCLWDFIGAFHFDLIPINIAITVNIYCQKLKYLNSVMKEKGLVRSITECMVFYHDNTWPFTVKIIFKESKDFDWGKIPYLILRILPHLITNYPGFYITLLIN